MSYPGYPEGLRISVGTDAEIDRLLEMLERDRLSVGATLSYNRRRNPPGTVVRLVLRAVRSGCYPVLERPRP